jgi:hypothetical protein
LYEKQSNGTHWLRIRIRGQAEMGGGMGDGWLAT